MIFLRESLFFIKDLNLSDWARKTAMWCESRQLMWRYVATLIFEHFCATFKENRRSCMKKVFYLSGGGGGWLFCAFTRISPPHLQAADKYIARYRNCNFGFFLWRPKISPCLFQCNRASELDVDSSCPYEIFARVSDYSKRYLDRAETHIRLAVPTLKYVIELLSIGKLGMLMVSTHASAHCPVELSIIFWYIYFPLDLLFFSMKNFIQHCFVYRPSDSTVSEDAFIDRNTVATFALAVGRYKQ